MKRKVLFLKAPANVRDKNIFLTPGKLYKANQTESSVFGTYFRVKNDSGNEFLMGKFEADDKGFESIHNTDIAAGIAVILILAGLAFWILNLIV